MEKQQQAQLKRMGKQVQNLLKTVTKIQTKLQKAGMSFSSDCQSATSDASTLVSAISGGSTDYDESDVREAMQNLGQCHMLGQQTLQVPTIYKTMSKAVVKYK